MAAAGNKFATFLHKNSSKITVILVYALLEWILIILLLLNSFFSYLITKFANYFGLKPPCPWCSRVDHVLEPGKNLNSYRDLVCDKHATEISKLSYCSNHGKLAESNLMCEECLASRPTAPSDDKSMTRTIAFISWMSSGAADDHQKINLPCCSCCNGSTKLHHPNYFMFKPSWGTLDYNAHKGSLIIEAVEDDQCSTPDSQEIQEGEDMIEIKLNAEEDGNEEEEDDERTVAAEEHQILSDDRDVESSGFGEAAGEDHLLDYFINLQPDQKCVSDRLFPVELIDLSTSANHCSENETTDSPMEETPLHAVDERAETTDMENPTILLADKGKEDSDDPPAHQQDKTDLDDLLLEQPKFEILLRTQHSDLPQVQEQVPSLQCSQEDSFSTLKYEAKEVDASESCINHNAVGENQKNSTMMNKMISGDENQEGLNTSLSLRLDHNEAEDEKLPDTPTSLEGMHYLHKKLLLFEKRESGIEESVDGSVVSEMESGDPIQTIESLKTALKAERKALTALYAELEEERSASAIAANHTMAMITRLQEEKATMQMEALQYQRMMEEQSEYDQEALQLLNELMIKREKEKDELEKELDFYRDKVLDYEAKEKMRRSKDGSVKSRKSSASCSYMEDSDELSIDLNCDAKEEDSSDNTPAEEAVNLEEITLDCVNHISALDESLNEFEEERLSILDQLKALEDKLLTMGDDQFMEDLKSIQNSFEENNDLRSKEENGGFSKKKTMASMAKSLLPFLDATEGGESEAIEMQYPGPILDLDSKKHAIEEEVDHVYERLQALEEDREFLKNCMGSIKKGDKGMDLLQEILQHLRDLRAVELRTTNMNDDPQV